MYNSIQNFSHNPKPKGSALMPTPTSLQFGGNLRLSNLGDNFNQYDLSRPLKQQPQKLQILS